MQEKERILDDLAYALEEFEKVSTLLQIAREVADGRGWDENHEAVCRWISLLIEQSLVINATGQDFIQHWPSRLEG